MSSEDPRISGAHRPLVGRAAALERLAAACALGPPIVTVRGAIGVGKSALVRAWAAGRAGVAVVDLHGADSIGALAEAFAAALDVRPPPAATDASHLDALRSALAATPTVTLVCDGIDALPEPARDALLALVVRPAAPPPVVTSRRALGVAGEALVELAPLDVPGSGAELSASGAGRLWLDRMALLSPGRVLGDEEREDVATLLRALDGLPLAIELAVRRERLVGARRLRERWTRDPSALAPLERALTASWAELGERERAVLADLCVFRRSWPLELAERVLAEHAPHVADVVQALIDRSYLELVPSDDAGPRVRMLAVLREDVARRRPERPSAETRRRHAQEHVRQARAWSAEIDRGALAARRALEAAEDDLAAALDHALAADDGSLAVEALELLDRIRWAGGAPDAHVARVARVAAWTGLAGLPAADAARVLEIRGRWETRMGAAQAEATLERALALAREAADPATLARVLRATALQHSSAGRPEAALAAIGEAVGEAARADGALHARCTLTEATLCRRAGRAEASDDAFARAHAAFYGLGDDAGRGATLAEWSMLQLERGRREEAAASAERARPLLARHGHEYLAAYLDATWAIQLQVEGALDAAIARYDEAARAAARSGDALLVHVCGAYRALAALERGAGDVAGALDALDRFDAVGAPPYRAVLRALLAFLFAEAHDPSIAREQLARAARHDLAPSNFRLAVELLSAGAELVLALRAGQIGAPEARARARGLLERASPDALRAADGSGEAVSDVRLATRLIERWVEERVEPPVVLVARDGRAARTARFGDVDLARRPLLGRLLLCLAEAARRGARDVAVDDLLEAGWPGEKMVGTSGVRRLQVAINRLRDLGLRDVVETVEGGYRIAEPWRVELDEE